MGFLVTQPGDLSRAVKRVLEQDASLDRMTAAAREVLAVHEGATQRTIELVEGR